ncbi:MAG: hypothetical protein ACLQNE_40635 [Thermoguttaceae bacterium]|jgi:hypothetical protein
MTMFPVTTLDQALQSLRQAFGCDAVVQDASETFYHDVPAVSESGAIFRNGEEVGTFAVTSVKSGGQDQVVQIRVGAVGELCADPDTAAHFDAWARTLEAYSTGEQRVEDML